MAEGGVYRDTMMIADRRPILIISGMIKHINSWTQKHCSGTNSLSSFFSSQFSVFQLCCVSEITRKIDDTYTVEMIEADLVLPYLCKKKENQSLQLR